MFCMTNAWQYARAAQGGLQITLSVPTPAGGVSPTRLTDEELIQQLYPQQPTQCFSALYERYAGRVYQRCMLMSNDAAMAQDFTQEIFLKVLAKLPAFQERSRFSTWLYRIAYNYCADQLRVGKRLPLVSLEMALLVEPAEAPVNEGPDDPLWVMQQALATLSVQDRSLLRLKYEQGLSIAQLATSHKLTESTVKVRLKRSRERVSRLANQLRDQ